MTKRGRKTLLNEVVVVLNDLQPSKVQLAENLADRLRERRIPCSLLSTTGELARTIELRQPSILVLDYLLGETMTALDLIEQFQRQNSLPGTQIVLWTDEPSIRVAVDSIRAGARDFIEMSDSRHLSRIVATIERLRTPPHVERSSVREERMTFRRIQPISLGLRESYRQAESLVANQCPIIVLLGERGSGRSSLARHLHELRASGSGRRVGVYREVELDLWPHGPARIVGGGSTLEQPHLLSHGATVMLDRAEFDGGELLKEVAQHASALFSTENPPLLIVGTTSEEVARGWTLLANAAVVELPPLNHRRDDVQTLIGEMVPNADPTLIECVMKERWPGGFRQLIVALQELDPTDGAEVRWHSLLRAKERWERFEYTTPTLPSLEQVRRVLAATDGNVQLAAAQLGVGVAQIRAAIHLPLTERPSYG